MLPFLTGSLACVAYAMGALLLAFRGRHTWPNRLLILAAIFTSIWAGSVAFLNSPDPYVHVWFGAAARVLRDGAWFAVVLVFIRQDNVRQVLWRRLALAAAGIFVVDLGFAIIGGQLNTGLGLWLSAPVIEFVASLFGLILVENLMRNLSVARAWSLRLMSIGLSALYGYNIALLLPEFLGGASIPVFEQVQPLAYLVVLPLFIVTAVRNDSLRLQMHSSRAIVFHSATVIFAGILLQGAALAAFYLRNFGGTPATVLAIVLGFTSLLGIAVALSSQSARSRVKTFINENFYNYKYDYRLEWEKFIQTLSGDRQDTGPERVLRTIANLLDSPGGVLWVRRAGWEEFVPLAHWSLGKSFGPIRAEDSILRTLQDKETVFLELVSSSLQPEAASWKERFPDGWLVVPLRFRDELIAVVLLQKPRAARRMDWEDRNLLSLTALELGAHLAHEHTAQMLADTQQLAEFNKRVTFAVHDLKNTSGQLTLLIRNAEKFGDNPDFRADMMATIAHAADNLQNLVAKLRGENHEIQPLQSSSQIDVYAVVASIVDKPGRSSVKFVRSGSESIYVPAKHAAALESALEHVVTNAVEASTANNGVRLKVEGVENELRVVVSDKGPGMSPEFVAQELFRPLRTTKTKGMGIGAYQARTMLRDLGGDLVVQSRLGEGTTVTLILPTAALSQKQAVA